MAGFAPLTLIRCSHLARMTCFFFFSSSESISFFFTECLLVYGFSARFFEAIKLHPEVCGTKRVFIRIRKEVESFLTKTRLAFVDGEDLASSILMEGIVDQLNPSKFLADKVGFEPTDASTSTVFKTAPISLTLAPVLFNLLIFYGGRG